MTIACATNVRNRAAVKRSVTAGSARSVPVAMVLRRLGWHHRNVSCRDIKGRRAALHVRRRAVEVVELQLADGQIVRMSNVEVGRLRAALRDVLIAQPQRHDNVAARSACPGIDTRHRCRDLT